MYRVCAKEAHAAGKAFDGSANIICVSRRACEELASAHLGQGSKIMGLRKPGDQHLKVSSAKFDSCCRYGPR